MKKLVVLSGAGMSAESGISTFRDQDGLWENHDVMEVASPQGWSNNQELVLRFYNQRRQQLKEVRPNQGHLNLVQLEKYYDTNIVTQNVDDLHERAGSSQIYHLHGELRKVRSTVDRSLIYDWTEDLNIGDRCEKGSQLRPHIVWFGESVPMIETALNLVLEAEIIVIIGTSMQVYPAAGLVGYARSDAQIYYIDPKPKINYELSQFNNLEIIEKGAGKGTQDLLDKLL